MTEIGRQKGDAPLIVALAAGATIRDAAKQAGVSEKTAHRRAASPDFQKRVSEARTQMVQRAVGMLSEASTEAVTTLRGLLDAESESVRLGACRAIVELGTRLRESEELERRIACLEDMAARASVRP
jgi:hypothetical protein